jgi:sporulation protein YlmC with PRC-barrel domain
MNLSLLATVSAMVLMIPIVSYAQEKTESTVNSDLNDAKKAVSSAVDTTKNAAQDAYDNIKAALITEEDKADFTYVTIDINKTAVGILNKPIFNTMNEKIGDVEDIILDEHGQARIVVISHGGFLGIGDKNAAFDYNLVMRRASDGDIIIPLSKDTIDTAKIFSYNRSEEGKDTRTISKDDISLKELMKAKLIDYKDNKISGIENIYFQDGFAYQLIVGFDKTLGLGGQKALMDYSGLKLIHRNGEYQFRMTQKQSLQFERFKKSSTK